MLRSTILRMTLLSVFDLAPIDACAVHDHAVRLRSGGLLAKLVA